MELYTIGFTKKSAKDFFELLRENRISTVIDIRLNKSSQLSGFAKGDDLAYFLKRILGIDYVHDLELSPTKEILDNYKKKNISWSDYEKEFINLMNERNIKDTVKNKYNFQLNKYCLLCSEDTADKCHRRLVAEFIKNSFPELDIQIIHL